MPHDQATSGAADPGSAGSVAALATQAAAPFVTRAVADQVTPGAVLEVTTAAGESATAAFGATAYGGPAVTHHTTYDLASVTKVTACLPLLLGLVESGEVRLTDTVDRFFANAGWMQTPSLGAVTLHDLALHRSGLEAWRPLFAWVSGRRAVIANVLQSGLPGPVGANVYSDLGVIVLTAVIERVTGQRIDQLAREWVFEPLGMAGARFGPLEGGSSTAATEDDGLRGLLVGRVHDENADAMEGVSGHAGLFGTADDLARYGRAWLRGEAPFAGEELLRHATTDLSDGAGARRGLLWRLSEPGWPFGDGPSAGAFGHTGFTGTSLLVDPGTGPGTGYVVVLLTNRVHPRRGSAEGIARLRRDVHGAVAAAVNP